MPTMVVDLDDNKEPADKGKDLDEMGNNRHVRRRRKRENVVCVALFRSRSKVLSVANCWTQVFANDDGFDAKPLKRNGKATDRAGHPL